MKSTEPPSVVSLLAALDCAETHEDRLPLLAAILVEEGHDRHEDIVFELGLIGDPLAVPAISSAVYVPFQSLVRWDNLQEFRRKCAYALARIGTEGSREALVEMSQHTDPRIQAYGEEGLSHWPLPLKR